MLINNEDLFHDKMIRIMDDNGKILSPEWKSNLSQEEIVAAFKAMLFARQADLKAVSYQRQGRMFTYPPNLGQEAIATAAGVIMKEDDWLVPAFREMAAWLAKGVSLEEIFLYFRGHEDSQRFLQAKHVFPISVPIASQLPHAVGIGYSIKWQKKNEVVFAFVGDGGTSEGDFHEALNFASVWKVPVVFIVQNNQYAISVPFSKQTASLNIAIKALAYGMPGVKVDGNDFFAMHEVLNEATEIARSGKGPVLIEAVTFRQGAHTTSDDPTKYRTSEEENKWQEKDPVKRFRAYLLDHKWWDKKQEEQLIIQFNQEIDRQFELAEKYPPYQLEDAFQYMFETMPDELVRQKIAYEKYLNWKEAQK